MKKQIITLALLSCANFLFAQQLQTSSFYDLQGVLHNPSMAGVGQSMIGATYRTQWSSISGSPQTATVFGSVGLKPLKIGLGGYIYNDQTGPTSRTGVQLSFAKHIPTNNEGVVSLGIAARGQQYSIDQGKLTAALGADPAITGNDNKFIFDAGFGISYSDKKLQLGASVSQLVQSKLNFYSGNTTRSEEGRLYRHYYFHGAYKWDVDPETSITPNLLAIYMPNAPTEYQFGARVEHNKLFWWGLSYRAKQSWMLSAGVNINKMFTVGYSFDIYETPVSVFDAGSNGHEILLRYNFSH